MDLNVFNIQKFNIIQDEENYYFFRALNMADNSDIEQQITVSASGKIERIRTDRERFNGETKYTEASNISLEEIYDHIKMHYRKDTNCISLTSNSNVAINYGRGSYKDKYVMVRIPKKEFGEKTVVAGQYMIQELFLIIQKSIENLPEGEKQDILTIFEDIEKASDNKTLKDIISKRYTAKMGEVNSSKAHLRKGITYSSPKARISSYQSLDEEQLLEVNKLYSKLAILENQNILKYVIPHSSNAKLRETIGNAFSSAEVIHYGDIKEENIIEVQKEIVDIFALLQQVNGVSENKLEEVKQALIRVVQSGKHKILEYDWKVKEDILDDISIEEMYKLTKGKIEFSKIRLGKANSISQKLYYLSKSRQHAIILSGVLDEILEHDFKYREVIQNINENGFRIEPEIISRKSGNGIKISESVNLDIPLNEQKIVEEVKRLSVKELENVIRDVFESNIFQDVINNMYGDISEREVIEKPIYYAEAIVSKYDWEKIRIEEFKLLEKNELIERLKEKECVQIYEKLKQYGIDESKIPTVLLNIAMREGFYEQYKEGNLEKLLNTRQDVLQNNINIEVVERFLGYYDIENTGIRLKEYQQRAYDNIDKIFEDKKFAQVILPTGAGKSFVALAQMQKYAMEHPTEKMLYLAPQDEILNQIKSNIIKYLHGKQETVGKTEDEIIAEVFPNIKFETYSGLLAKRGQEVIEEQYGMIVLDELHRTGAKEWEGKVDALFENQTDNVKVLGITATPVRDVDGRDMANEIAKKLGYSEEEISKRKHLASNMTLENAIRMGYVVNPKLVYCKYDLISSGKMDELREKIDSIEDEEKRTKQLQKYNELRQKLNQEIDEEIGEEARKKIEEDARKNLDSGIGKEEILRENVKKGGKYIVFIPVTDQGDIEDESGNRIGTKTGEDKIKAYQDYLNKVFEGTEIEPELHSLLGSYSKDKNKEELDGFESDNSDKTKFMVVMNKANEGLHIAGIDGIIWFRALDENSKILYLQQLGRAIYALDEDNPLPDDKRPTVIDLANNSLTVNIEKEFENVQPIDDLEALTIIIEWINEHDGMLPDRNSSNKQEKHYYAVLRRIQSKYNKYLEGFKKFEDLTQEDIDRITEIIELATEIDLWNIDLPPIPKLRGSKEEFEPFTIDGVLRDFVEFKDEIDKLIPRGRALKNALEIEYWCKVNYGNKEIWNRKLPSQNSNDEKEKRLGKALNSIKQLIIKKYEGKEIKEVENEEYISVIEIVRKLDKEYGLSGYLKNALEIENWCKVNYGDKKIWNRKLPNSESKDKEEKRIGKKLHGLRYEIIKQYEGKRLEEVKNEEHRRIIEIVRRLDKEYGLSGYLKNALEIENWCKVNYGDKKIWNRKLPNTKSKDMEENRLGRALANLKIMLKQYKDENLEGIENKEHRMILEIIRRLDEDYGLDDSLKRALEIKNWCEVNYGNKKEWEKKLPSRSNNVDKEEKTLAVALNTLRTKIKQYEGINLEKIENKEHRKITEIVRRLDVEYGKGESLKNALEIENWCKVNYGNKEDWEKKLPTQANEADEEEKRLGKALQVLRITKIKQYEGINLEKIENVEHRKITEIVRRLDKEYGLSGYLKNALEIKNWCEVNYGDKKKWEKKLPSRCKDADEEEKRLCDALGNLKSKLKQYEGKEIGEVKNEEDRKILEIVRSLDEEYGIGDSLKRALEIQNWCEVNYGEKEDWEKKLPSRGKDADGEEKRLGVALNTLRGKLKKYEGKDLREVKNDEDRKILEILKRLDEEYNPKKEKQQALQQAKIRRDEAKYQNNQAKQLEKQVSGELEKRGKNYEKQ